MTSTYLTFSIFDPLDREFKVGGHYSPGCEAQTSGPVEGCYPAEPDELTIDSITLDGKPLPEDFFTDTEAEDLQARAEEKAREVYTKQQYQS